MSRRPWPFALPKSPAAGVSRRVQTSFSCSASATAGAPRPSRSPARSSERSSPPFRERTRASRQLEDLKQRLGCRFVGYVHKYSARWTGNSISTDHLSVRGMPARVEEPAEPRVRAQPPSPEDAPNLCRDVYSCLAGVIQQEL